MTKTLLAVLIAVFTLCQQLSAAMCVKIWYYGRSERGSWQFQWQDQWGGLNYWCIGSGNECGLYD